MTLTDLTQSAVNRALAEFDELSRERFLEKYGFGPSRGYYLVKDGRRYDSKAIAGAAHQFVGGRPLAADEFSGGEKTVATVLRNLGYAVETPTTRMTAEIPYHVGETYHRQRDIHQRFAGQERGGISYPKDVPFVFLFTGSSGEGYGYADTWLDDGTFLYTGEGQEGDMQFLRGNREIRDHAANGKELLLFQALPKKGFYRFHGCFACAGWEIQRLPDRTGRERDAIVFRLIPETAIDCELDVEAAKPAAPVDLQTLRALAYAAAAPEARAKSSGTRNYYERSKKVKDYVLARAAGRCEYCEAEAPFLRLDGTPYLEPHHIKRLADGGPDSPDSIAAICPTCHRRAHYGADREVLNAKLADRIRSKEK